jgi:zinc protease
LDEVTKLITDGPKQVNINKWRSEMLRLRETEVRTNEWWLGYISGQIQNEEKLTIPDVNTGIINAVTPNDVKKIAEKYLDGHNLIKLILLPEHVISQ